MGSADLAGQYHGNHTPTVAGNEKPSTPHSDAFKVLQSGLPLHFIHGQPQLTATPRTTPWLLQAKRVTDIVFSVIAFVALSPLLVIVALLVKVTSVGPVLFTQNREGLNGKEFRMYKFRTLHWGESDISGLKAVKAADPRLTRVGAFLRRTSFDELPQLFNIILGDMSLVGPRPQVPGMLVGEVRYDKLVPYYHMRNTMKPGLTGWAQANGLRGTVETTEAAKARVDHDLAYINNFSFKLDIKILIWTIWQEVLQVGRGT